MGKNLAELDAALAYNLGIAPGAIDADGIINANPDTNGAADYDFSDSANFDDTVNNQTKYVHHTLLANDPVTNVA